MPKKAPKKRKYKEPQPLGPAKPMMADKSTPTTNAAASMDMMTTMLQACSKCTGGVPKQPDPNKGQCFGAGTLVWTERHGKLAIEDVRIGMRVTTWLSDRSASEPEARDSAIDPATWRVVVLRLDYGDGWGVDVRLLRDPGWFAANGVIQGGIAHLHLEEMGVIGDAEVVAIEKCPELENGSGRLVTAEFRHWRGQVWDLHVEGEPEPIRVTERHPFWSADRQTWIPVVELVEKERLHASDGARPRTLGLSNRDKSESVYNIEVDSHHCYRVAEQGLLVHNASALRNYPKTILNGKPGVG